jgi:tyramine---L-glutamate ligase
MQIFIYEYITGGGLWEGPDDPASSPSLLQQGRAMVQAITADFCALPGAEVWTTRDQRLPPLHPPACRVTIIAGVDAERRAIEELAASADWTMLIAPETANCLAQRCDWVTAAGGRLLSPSKPVVSLTTDKHATAQWLSSRGIPVPRGVLLPRSPFQDDLAFPLVLKPLDGCGSEGLHLVQSAAELSALNYNQPLRCEEFIPGLAASVAVLCGPAGNYSLPAGEQCLTADGRFTYLGGRLPLPADLDRRARRLAESAVAMLPTPLGYIGVDLVLGDAPDGSGDRIIEINPRLTTSYVGLRAASRTNLAAALLATAEGHAPDLCFNDRPVEFASDGVVVSDRSQMTTGH